MQAIYNLSKLYLVKWRVTDWCNYKCDFCNRDFSNFTKKEVVYIRSKKIGRLLKSIPQSVKLSLIGGEIMFYDMSQIIPNIISPNLKRIAITSNFSAPLQNYVNLIKICRIFNLPLTLILSLHESKVDVDIFFSKIKNLLPFRNRNVRLRVNFVVTPSNECIVGKVKEKARDLEVECLFEDVQLSNKKIKKSNKGGALGYSFPSFEIIDDNGDVCAFVTKNDCLLAAGGVSPKGFYCSQSLSFIEVQEDDIFGSSCRYKEKIGTLDEGFVKRGVVCQNDGYCNLAGGISIDINKERLETKYLS